MTAEEFQENNFDGLREALKDDDLYFFYKGVISEYAIAFAKIKVEEALLAVKENIYASCNICCSDKEIYIDEKSILNAYPSENIK